MTFALSAISRAADLDTAIDEVEASLQRDLAGRRAEAAIFFVSSQHALGYPTLGSTLRERLGVDVVGCSTVQVMDRTGDAEGRPGLGVLLVGSDVAGTNLAIQPFAVPNLDTEGSKRGTELTERLRPRTAQTPGEHQLLIVLPDAYVGSLAPFLKPLLGEHIIGGAPSENGLGRTYQWGPDGKVMAAGACGWFVRGDLQIDIAVAQGCAPVGPEFEVTEAVGPVIMTLDGRPALEVFVERLPVPLRMQLPRALRTVSVTTVEGDGFVAHQIIGLEADRQGLVCASPIATGQKVRFAIRESGTARDDMRKQLEKLSERLRGRKPLFGLYFDAIGRGQSLYGLPDLDASLIDGALGEFPWIGMSSSAEVASFLGETRLLSFSGVLGVVSE